MARSNDTSDFLYQSVQLGHRKRNYRAQKEYERRYRISIFFERQGVRWTIAMMLWLPMVYFAFTSFPISEVRDSALGWYWFGMWIGLHFWFNTCAFISGTKWGDETLTLINNHNKGWLSPVGKFAYDNFIELEALAKMQNNLNKR